MKKIWIASIVAVLIIFVGIGVTYKEDLDRFNPFYKKEIVYVQINEQPKPDEPNGKRFKYKLTGYNAEGKERKVTFSTGSELEEGTYLKVWAKGAYTEKWDEIPAESVPKTINW